MDTASNCPLNTCLVFIPIDQCKAQQSSEKLLFVVYDAQYTDLQLVQVQRIRECRVLSPTWGHVYQNLLYKAQRLLWKMENKKYKNQKLKELLLNCVFQTWQGGCTRGFTVDVECTVPEEENQARWKSSVRCLHNPNPSRRVIVSWGC